MARAQAEKKFEYSVHDSAVKAGLEISLASGVEMSRILDVLDRSSDWTARPLTELVNHIASTHHAAIRTELPRISALGDKVKRSLSRTHPDFANILRPLDRIRRTLIQVMLVEEEVIFPRIRLIESDGEAPWGCIETQIHFALLQYDDSRSALENLRKVSLSYCADCAPDYQEFLIRLEWLENEVRHTVEMANSILYPRAISMERHARATHSR